MANFTEETTKMTDDILIPSDTNFVSSVARAIARQRLWTESVNLMKHDLLGASDEIVNQIVNSSVFVESFDETFEMLWARQEQLDELVRSGFMEDARAAISAINLNLLTK